LLVPGWVPDDLKFSEAWVFGDRCEMAIIRYSDGEIAFQGPLPVSERDGHPRVVISVHPVLDEEEVMLAINQTIEVKRILLEEGEEAAIRYLMEKGNHDRETAEWELEQLKSTEVVEVNGVIVLLDTTDHNRFGEPIIWAELYYDGRLYTITMLATRYTEAQLMQVVESMLLKR